MFFLCLCNFKCNYTKNFNYIFFGVFEIRFYYSLPRWLRTLAIDACAMAFKTVTAGYRYPCVTNGVAC